MTMSNTPPIGGKPRRRRRELPFSESKLNVFLRGSAFTGKRRADPRRVVVKLSSTLSKRLPKVPKVKRMVMSNQKKPSHLKVLLVTLLVAHLAHLLERDQHLEKSIKMSARTLKTVMLSHRKLTNGESASHARRSAVISLQLTIVLLATHQLDSNLMRLVFAELTWLSNQMVATRSSAETLTPIQPVASSTTSSDRADTTLARINQKILTRRLSLPTNFIPDLVYHFQARSTQIMKSVRILTSKIALTGELSGRTLTQSCSSTTMRMAARQLRGHLVLNGCTGQREDSSRSPQPRRCELYLLNLEIWRAGPPHLLLPNLLKSLPKTCLMQSMQQLMPNSRKSNVLQKKLAPKPADLPRKCSRLHLLHKLQSSPVLPLRSTHHPVHTHPSTWDSLLFNLLLNLNLCLHRPVK